MNDRDFQIIFHIRNYCEETAKYIVRFGDSYESFQNDSAYYNAVCMCIMQVGELSARLSEDFKNKTRAFIPWSLVKSMRNHFAHSYSEMEPETIWETLNKDLPTLKKHCDEWLDKS
ncbi:antitoxin [Clostridia bacterium]|nr:antitoxin [Clostridia bacterium]